MRPRGSRFAAAAAVAAVLAVGLGVASWLVWSAREAWFEGGLEEARAAMLDGRHATARRRLVALVERRPRHPEALYLLGLSEQAMGHPEAAEEAWGRIPEAAPERGLALLHWADIEQYRGRLADAEDRLRAALEIPGAHRPMARWALVRLIRPQGRFDEAGRIFREGLVEHPEPVEALRVLYQLETDAFPIDLVRRDYELAHRLAPEDDRVWLGLAHLAARSGHFDEAEKWLDRCRSRRPDDPVVWRARLDWALAAHRPEAAAEAIAHLPARAGPEGEAEELTLRAWFARLEGDRPAERRALEAVDRLDPSRPEVIDRLAALAAEEGRAEAAAGYRAVRERLERDRERYVALLRAEDPASRFRELSQAAAALGRRFDAAAWLALADGSVAEEELPERPAPSGQTLADRLAGVVARASAPAASSSGEPSLIIPRFEDAAEAAGLDFVHDRGHQADRLVLPETGAGGVALLDFDGDGFLDLYAVQAGSFPPPPDSGNGDRLYRNRGDGTFEDVSESSGIASFPGGYGHGVAVGDIDNDGHPDLLVTRWRSYALYRNLGDGTFADATEASGLAGDRDWPTSAAFADLDNDGDLDLYVCHYLSWDEFGDRSCVSPDDPTVYSCNPRDFPAEPDRVYRNDGGRFVDVTESAGIVDRDGRGLGVVAADVNEDGLIDLFVANDMTADYLFLNRGGFQFEELGAASGVSANAHGNYQAGMGTACGDLDGDGRLDLLVTNYYDESTTFFRNLGGGIFADQSAAINLEAPSRHLLGFGLVLLDANLDGRLDVLTANGHVHDGRPRYPYRMPAQLLLGGPGGRLVDPGSEAGSPFETRHLGRGLASGDLDNDGRPDAVLQAQDEPLVFLHNRTEGAGRFLMLRLEGTESNRDGVGAVVTVRAGGRAWVAARVGGGSFQSASDPRLHFGLGAVERVDAIEVRWPSGRVDRFGPEPADAALLIREGAAAPRPLAGAARPSGPEAAAGERGEDGG
ncbi:FG-GAP-like repeat-containing protein [Tautonia sociabilis]|uniref:Tetratricopeptide repeat protein n=1 Tax=Tautonia sociabilis TaxID=2080755 RepID=A0A432MNX9_9BACT|nr:FG-GAP-like repeat-containing protein [Tautonia sociabilis]RUL89112.1 tetratricopeptide repeat protein [Tautonia sociabilis]